MPPPDWLTRREAATPRPRQSLLRYFFFFLAAFFFFAMEDVTSSLS